MHESIDTPLGPMRRNESDDGTRFLTCHVQIDGEPIFMNIKVESFDALEWDTFAFANEIIETFDSLKRHASDYLTRCYEDNPEPFGGRVTPKVPVVTQPELTFWRNRRWSIRFIEGMFRICEPYGIFVHFEDKEVTGWEDLSDAEEL
ncbi:hypothetical protein AWB80_06458 [Caballeronia pedi]|uniref:Uncharacterized protein n=1 Tax=Caballeronia pedi TaxID=1777141 RepID=A0A158D7M7_9BURK|nr:hypothetical protein [Caballeronia pedi]SAK90655.1 hypothetical protein AWB80_06458 [Caballeronia pedi]